VIFHFGVGQVQLRIGKPGLHLRRQIAEKLSFHILLDSSRRRSKVEILQEIKKFLDIDDVGLVGTELIAPRLWWLAA
jgi:hypothetical protein